jgi:hypothetical protein
MNDEQHTPSLGRWLKDSDVAPPDPQTSARQIMAALPESETPRRWWPFRRRATPVHRSSSTQSTDFQPSPIPSANGHPPTVLGRTQSMFSPVKAITAGALIFALGGVLLIAQPFDQQGGSVPGAATDTEPAQTVEVTGEVFFSSGDGSLETWVADDARLTGSGRKDSTEGFQMERPPTYFLDGRFLETDDGTWRQLPVPTINIPGYEGILTSRKGNPVWDMVLVGEGGYEGLVFIAQAEWADRGLAEHSGFDVHGYIADAEAPQPVESTPSE